jgi:voltage-gated potassium channel
MDTLKAIVNDETRIGHIVGIFIQILIVISLISFSIETLPNLSEGMIFSLKMIELITVIFFTIEYVLRLITAEKKLSFVFSFYGIIDFLAIFPFYVARSFDLRSLRIFRLLRLFRVLKLFRYSKAIVKLKEAFLEIKEELVLFSIIAIFVIYASAVGIYYFEHEVQPKNFQSVFHCLWWAVATLTTVGYGDVFPITIGGRIFTFVMLMIGLGIIAVPTGLVASAFTNSTKKGKKDV